MSGERIYVEESTEFLVPLLKTIVWDRKAPVIVSQR